MPKMKPGSWSGWRIDAADLSDENRRYASTFHAKRLLHCDPATCRRDEVRIVRWLRWLQDAGVPFPDAREDDAVAFCSLWRTWGWNPATCKQFISTMRVFHDHWSSRGVGGNPWRTVRGPAIVETVPQVLSRSEVERMAAAMGRGTWRDLRDRSLLLMLAESGCRIAEILGLALQDVSMDQREMLVTGKGHKQRISFLV